MRAARPSDAAAVAALQVRSWQRAYRGTVPGEFLDDLSDVTWLDRWTAAFTGPRRDGVHQFVSVEHREEVPQAVAVCGPARDDVEAGGQLYVLYVDAPSWGRGHGSALLRRVHAALAEDGHARAGLWVAATNRRAIDFYNRHGWAADGAAQREEVAGATFDEIRMVRALGE